MTDVVTILNNSTRTLSFGDGGAGDAIALFCGATQLPKAIFDAVLARTDGQGEALRAALKAGTLCEIDNAEPLKPEQVARMKSDLLIAAACKHGDQQTRARLAQRQWILAGQHDFQHATSKRELFHTLMGEHNDSPSDPHDGWRCWAKGYAQAHQDAQLVIIKQQAAAQREHAERMAAIAAAATAKVK